MSSIRKNIRSGVFFTALSRYSNVVVSIVIGAILARLLTPEEFGVVAIISVFITFFNLLSSFGISAAIVQHQSLNEIDISSIFSFSIFFGLMSATVFYFFSPFIAEFYNNPVLINISRLMALAILFNTIKIVPNALNRKALRFKELGIISLAVHIITGIFSIILAYLGFSYYSLVINSILNGLLLFLSFYYLAPIKPSFIRIKSIRKIAKFSTYQFMFQFINYFAGNSDNLLIGKFFSASALGFYDKAYKLMMLPVKNLTFVITPVLHPILSEYQNDKDVIYKTYYKIVKFLAIIGFPLTVFLFFSASEIINIMYGPQWGESIPVFKLLALAVGIQIVLSSTGSIFQATGRTDLLFYSGLLSTALVVLGILFGIFIGKDLVSIGQGILIAFIINMFQAFYLLLRKSLERSFLEFLKVFYFPFVVSLGLVIALWIESQLLIENLLLSFVIKVIVSVVVFLLILISSKENFNFIKEYSRKMIKK